MPLAPAEIQREVKAAAPEYVEDARDLFLAHAPRESVIEANTARHCIMNLYLHGIDADPCPLKSGADSLARAPGERFSVVLTNPPFGKKSSINIFNEAGDLEKDDTAHERQDFWTTTRNKQLNFVQHIKTLLQVNGRCAIVVPDNVLFEGGAGETVRRKPKPKQKDKTVSEQLAQASPELLDLYEALKATCTGFGDDVQTKMLKLYIAFKRIKNFVSVEVRASANLLIVYLKVDPDTVELKEGFSRDVRNIGHWGTGDLEITIRNRYELEKTLPLLEKSYEAS